MFLLKIFYFLKGYVIIDIIDGECAKLVNMCAEKGIYIRNITPCRVTVRKCDLERLLKEAKRAGIAVLVAEKRGFSEKYLSGLGWFTLLCALMFTLFFVMSAQYVWELEINGCDEAKAAEVAEALAGEGLRVGVRKSSLPDGNTLRDSVIYSVDGINWAWVYLDGTLARVEVAENIPAPAVDTSGEPCNVSAAREGILTFISAKHGRTVMNEGDKVSPGDIVISGAMPGGEKNPPYSVAAEGEVYAETVHNESCFYPLTKTYTRDTGEELILTGIRLFELELPLTHVKSIPFDEYRVEANTPPAGICSYRYIATETYAEQIPIETAEAEAKELMYERISAKLAPGSRRTGERITTTRVSEDMIKVTLTMSFIENIGQQTPIELWQTEELTNDETD